MPSAPRTINVVANPFIAVDQDGIPQGVVAMPGMSSMALGARVDAALSAKTGKQRFYFPLNREKTPIVLAQFTPTIVRSVQEGELIAADEKSARMCGLQIRENKKDAPLEELQGFLPWEQALEREKARAQAYYASVVEDGEVKDIPREEDADAKAWLLKTEDEAAATKATPTDKKGADKKTPNALVEIPIGGRTKTGGTHMGPGLTLESVETVAKKEG